MPFTFSHPAIILPFSKIRSGYISVSGLVIGSITPDFEYFLTMKATGRFSHSLPGIFLFDLPVAFVVLLIFHLAIKKPFIENTPAYFKSRLADLHDFHFALHFRKHFVGYLLCLLAGIASHIAWDTFTHANEFFVNRSDILKAPLNISGLPNWPLFRYLQHLSTVVGALAIVYVFHHRPARHTLINEINGYYWAGVLATALCAFFVRWSFGFEYFADIVATIISSLLLGILITSLIFIIRLPRNLKV
jgi:hypothetical protein